MNIIKKVFGPKPPSEFFMQFTRAVHQRGCVAYFQDVNQTELNAVGILETVPEEAGITKLILLPGDDHSKISERNLVAFEPLNRRHRKALEKERSKLVRTSRKK